MAKTLKNFRLSDPGIELLKAMSEKLGVKETAVLEMAIREKAAAMGITAPKS